MKKIPKSHLRIPRTIVCPLCGRPFKRRGNSPGSGIPNYYKCPFCKEKFKRTDIRKVYSMDRGWEKIGIDKDEISEN